MPIRARARVTCCETDDYEPEKYYFQNNGILKLFKLFIVINAYQLNIFCSNV